MYDKKNQYIFNQIQNYIIDKTIMKHTVKKYLFK